MTIQVEVISHDELTDTFHVEVNECAYFVRWGDGITINEADGSPMLSASECVVMLNAIDDFFKENLAEPCCPK